MPIDAKPIPWDDAPSGPATVTVTPRPRRDRTVTGSSRTTTVAPRE